MKLLIVNGPNLNLLGTRSPEIYGDLSFEDFFKTINVSDTVELDYYQSNVEGELINTLHAADVDGIIINAGGYTHTSVALRDAIEAITTPVVEVHISNISKREPFRHESMLSPVCEGCIFGFGLQSYELAIHYFLNKR